jgi:type VI secretion system FHA domain protein
VSRSLAVEAEAYYKEAAIMAIKLRVISDQYRELGEQRSRVFGVNGGTIGRAPDNDWVLPDPSRVVSGHHCEIEYRGGLYWLKDTSTNGVFVNDSDEPVLDRGPVVLRDGDRLAIGDYMLVVSVDSRIDFLPAAAEEHSAAKHLDEHIGADLDMESLLGSRTDTSGAFQPRNAFGMTVPIPAPPVHRPLAPPQPEPEPEREPEPELPAQEARPPVAPVKRPAVDPPAPAAPSAPAAPGNGGPEWAMHTRAITRQELADAMARRQSRIEARQQVQPFHQQASTWTDLKSAVQAFCRGAGIDPSALSAEAQSMLPLVAGQLLREAVVGLNDLAQSRAQAAPVPAGAQPGGSNPLRTSSSVEQALVRLFESHGRIYGGPVDALRDVLQEAKDHEAAVQAGMQAGLDAVLGQLSPSNVADQFEQGRAHTLAPGQDPRPKYWEHYAEFFRVITQGSGAHALPIPFTEEFARAYSAAREELRAKRRERDADTERD